MSIYKIHDQQLSKIVGGALIAEVKDALRDPDIFLTIYADLPGGRVAVYSEDGKPVNGMPSILISNLSQQTISAMTRDNGGLASATSATFVFTNADGVAFLKQTVTYV